MFALGNAHLQEMEEKIALFCDIDKDAVIQVVDAESIYEVPLTLKEQGLDDIVVERLGLNAVNLI